jgi:1-acyl-sn-glycerol-3-phosphate acyltransferase
VHRPSWKSGTVDFGGRKGFIRLALSKDVPIVPVVSIGGQETALFLGRGRRLARALQLDRRFRLKVLPPVLGPPFGLNIMDLPGRVPLPAKISIRVGKPIDLRERLGQRPDPDDGYRLVTSTMQRTLTRLSNQRTLPVVG